MIDKPSRQLHTDPFNDYIISNDYNFFARFKVDDIFLVKNAEYDAMMRFFNRNLKEYICISSKKKVIFCRFLRAAERSLPFFKIIDNGRKEDSRVDFTSENSKLYGTK